MRTLFRLVSNRVLSTCDFVGKDYERKARAEVECYRHRKRSTALVRVFAFFLRA
jgi:hypothetical protein